MKSTQQLMSRIRDRKKFPVSKEISGLDEQVYIREISVAERSRLIAMKETLFFPAYLLVFCVVDLNNEPMFKDEDAQKMAEATMDNFTEIFGDLLDEALKINGFLNTPAEAKEAEDIAVKNLETIQSDNSGSN